MLNRYFNHKRSSDRLDSNSNSYLYTPNPLIAMLSLILVTAAFSVICGTIWSLTRAEKVRLSTPSPPTSQQLNSDFRSLTLS